MDYAQWNLEKQGQIIPGNRRIEPDRLRSEEENSTICHTDAAWDKTTSHASLAWVFTNPSPFSDHQGSRVQSHVSSPIMAEALAVRSTLQQAVLLDLTNTKIYSDNQTLIRVINNELFDKEIYGVVHDITNLSALFVHLSFFSISRAENGKADFWQNPLSELN